MGSGEGKLPFRVDGSTQPRRIRAETTKQNMLGLGNSLKYQVSSIGQCTARHNVAQHSDRKSGDVPTHPATARWRPHVGTDGASPDDRHFGSGIRRHERGERAPLSTGADGCARDLNVGASGVCTRGIEEGGADSEVGVRAVCAGFGCDGG